MRFKEDHIYPIRHRVLIKTIEVEDKTRSGLVIPHSAKDKEQQGVQFSAVLRLGPDAFRGEGFNADVTVGDIVVTDRYPGARIYSAKFDKSEEELSRLRVINDEEVIAVIHTDNE